MVAWGVVTRGRLRAAASEAAIGLGAYAVDLLVRRRVYDPEGQRRAIRNAQRLLVLERRLGLSAEPAVQSLVVGHRRVCRVLDVSYVTLNVVLTIGLPIALWAREDPRFPWLRRSVALSILASNAVYAVFPCAPPRKLPGFVDTISEVGGPDVDTGVIARLYNPIAAFPSMHLAFAVVTTVGLRAIATKRSVRSAALAYPPAVAFTVLATGNHFVVDVLAGSMVGLVAVVLSRRLER